MEAKISSPAPSHKNFCVCGLCQRSGGQRPCRFLRSGPCPTSPPTFYLQNPAYGAIIRPIKELRLRKNVIVQSAQRAGDGGNPAAEAIVPLSEHSGDEPEDLHSLSCIKGSAGIQFQTGNLGGNAEVFRPISKGMKGCFFQRRTNMNILFGGKRP